MIGRLAHTTLASALGLGCALASAQPAGDAQRFDGTWTTIVECANAPDGALGYSKQFDSTVKDGMFFGESDREGQPGWLRIQGRIDPTGKATLLARGLTSDPKYSVDRVPNLTRYSYRVDARFDDKRGIGSRIELRKCDLTFIRH
ncbi:MAG TPA: hypothetical protein VFC24_14170 [Casimicrobiaceae bacterium]|nr:hypothetical protein [Casimicrobiaceae bacterium]